MPTDQSDAHTLSTAWNWIERIARSRDEKEMAQVALAISKWFVERPERQRGFYALLVTTIGALSLYVSLQTDGSAETESLN